MIEIWTEDSTVGYKYINTINREKFKRLYKVVPHRGAGEAKPTSELKYGGIKYHLKHYNITNQVLLMVDKIFDKHETLENYNEILEIINNRDNIKMIDIHCFETCIISYKNIDFITGRITNRLNIIRNDYINIYMHRGEWKYTNKIRELSKEFIDYIKQFSINNCHSEHIAKSLLAEITSNPIIKTTKDTLTPAYINGGKIGNCWITNCCSLLQPECRQCRLNENCSLGIKLDDVIDKSMIGSIVSQISYYTDEYIISHYYNRSNVDDNYRIALFNKVKNKETEYKIKKLVIEIIEKHGKWRYEQVYREALRKRYIR